MDIISHLKQRSRVLIGLGVVTLAATITLSVALDVKNEYGFITIIMSVFSGALVGEGFLARQKYKTLEFDKEIV